MKIETRFDSGERIYFTINGFIYSGKIKGVRIISLQKNIRIKTEISYLITDVSCCSIKYRMVAEYLMYENYEMGEKQCFLTLQEAQKECDIRNGK